MADIKVKESKKGTVKTINKAVVGTEKMKDRLVQAKDKTKETYQEETSDNGTEYAINKISKTASNLPNNVYRLNKYGKKNFDKTVQNIQNVNQKIKTIKSERKLYYAYLNMFPQCVLDMGKYVDNSDRSTEAVFIPDINYCEDGQCILSLGKPAYKQNQNLPAGFEGFCPKSLLRHLNFYNYIFTVDNELQIISVYSAARQNAVIGYNVVTFAQRSEGGDAAKQALRNIAAKNKLLGNILYKIDN